MKTTNKVKKNVDSIIINWLSRIGDVLELNYKTTSEREFILRGGGGQHRNIGAINSSTSILLQVLVG